MLTYCNNTIYLLGNYIQLNLLRLNNNYSLFILYIIFNIIKNLIQIGYKYIIFIKQ